MNSVGLIISQPALPFGMQHHVPRQFSDRYHVWCFLQLDRLLVDKSASVVQDHVGIKRTVLRLTFWCRSTWLSAQIPVLAVAK